MIVVSPFLDVHISFLFYPFVNLRFVFHSTRGPTLLEFDPLYFFPFYAQL